MPGCGSERVLGVTAKRAIVMKNLKRRNLTVLFFLQHYCKLFDYFYFWSKRRAGKQGDLMMKVFVVKVVWQRFL